MHAGIFSDCFAACSGVLSGSAPGPICGWTYSEVYGPLGGTVTLTPGSMSFDTHNDTEFPGAIKPLPASLPSIYNLSGKFKFKEYQTPPNPLTSYTLNINNVDVTQVLVLGLFGDGSVVFQFGDPSAADNYTGTWVPNLGVHEVAFSLSSAGVPKLWIDGVQIPLTFAGAGTSSGSFFPGDIIAMYFGSGDPTPGTSPVNNLFVTSGVKPPSTKYCCP